MKYLIYSFVLLFSNCLIAQTPYETMDSLSAEIRNLQYSANGLFGSDLEGNFELSFPEDNFNFLISTRQAYHAIYKKIGDQDILTIIEEIDLSKAISIETELINDKLGVVKLWFPKEYLQSNSYVDGKAITSSTKDFLPFYFNRNSSQNNDLSMMNSVVEICHRTKIDNGTLTEEEANEMIKQVEWLRKNYSYNNISNFNQFLEKYPSSLFYKEVQKSQAELTEIRKKEIQRAKEVEEGIKNIQRFFSQGKQSYKNFQYFGQADSLANKLLINYALADFSAGKYNELKNLRPELKERYRWNKEYYEKRDKILEYDALVLNSIDLNYKYMNKLDATVNGTMYVKATLLALGGMATLMGAYAVLAKDDSFSKSTATGLLKYGGAAFGIGLTWTILQNRSVKKAGDKAVSAQREVDEMKNLLGPVLDKRNEALNGSPLININ